LRFERVSRNTFATFEPCAALLTEVSTFIRQLSSAYSATSTSRQSLV
jgi:hypothetical protein